MPTSIAGTSKPNWSFQFKVWSRGGIQPFPDALHVAFTRPAVSNTAADETTNALMDKWQKQGLGLASDKAVQVSLDVSHGRYNFSLLIDLARMNQPFPKVIEPSDPFNWCACLDTAFVTRAVTGNKFFDKDPSAPPRINSTLVFLLERVDLKTKKATQFGVSLDWVNILMVYSLFEIARHSGTIAYYRGTEGLINLAQDAGIDQLSEVYDAAFSLNLDKRLDLERFNLRLWRIKGYVPQLLRWARSNKISFYDALRSFEGKSLPECRKTYKDIAYLGTGPVPQNTQESEGRV